MSWFVFCLVLFFQPEIRLSNWLHWTEKGKHRARHPSGQKAGRPCARGWGWALPPPTSHLPPPTPPVPPMPPSSTAHVASGSRWPLHRGLSVCARRPRPCPTLRGRGASQTQRAGRASQLATTAWGQVVRASPHCAKAHLSRVHFLPRPSPEQARGSLLARAPGRGWEPDTQPRDQPPSMAAVFQRVPAPRREAPVQQ